MNENEIDSTLWLTPLVLDQDFSVQFRGDHIHVELGPEFKVVPDKQDEFWNKIKTVCDEHDSRRVLVEGFVPSGERDTGEVVEAGLRTAVIPKMWLAFHLINFVPTERSELFERIAASQGVRVKFFSETERALNWLRQNTPR